MINNRVTISSTPEKSKKRKRSVKVDDDIDPDDLDEIDDGDNDYSWAKPVLDPNYEKGNHDQHLGSNVQKQKLHDHRKWNFYYE
jgi:hypothetical protein